MGAPQPEAVGRYRILDVLGHGAMGIVYRGRDEALERDVAIKVMSANAEAESRRRFEREARAAARLQHPNIVTIYELGEHKGAPFIAMELLEGIDLQHAITAGLRPDPRVTLPIVLQLLAGLQHAHEHGIVHRDIKPSNIFLPHKQPAKIMDFGVARLSGGGTTAGAIVGTPNYMSPEQVQGAAVDGRSDLFSAGLILYELVTGERAYAGTTVVAVLFKIAHEPPDLSLLPHAREWQTLARVIRRALTHSVEERYAEARAMSADLAQALLEMGGTADWAGESDRGVIGRHTPRPMRRPVHETPPPPRPAPSVHPAAPSPPSEVSLEEDLPAVEAPLAAGNDAAPRAALWLVLLVGVPSLAVLVGGGLVLLLRPTAGTPPPATTATRSPGPNASTTSRPATSIPTAPVDLATPRPSAPPEAAATPALGAEPRPSHEPLRLGGLPVTPTPPPATPPVAPPSSVGSAARLERANAQLEARHYQAAINEARAVLARDPDNEEARAIVEDATASLEVERRIKRARELARRGDKAGALVEVQAGLELAPSDSRLRSLSAELGG